METADTAVRVSLLTRRPSWYPASALRQGSACLRHWIAGRRKTLRCAAVLIMIAAAWSLPSALVWHLMAGERVALEPRGHHVSTSNNRPVAPNEQPVHRPSPPRTTGTVHPARATTSDAPATTISGTTVALAIVVGLAAAAIGAARAVLSRLRHRGRQQSDSHNTSDPEPDDLASETADEPLTPRLAVQVVDIDDPPNIGDTDDTDPPSGDKATEELVKSHDDNTQGSGEVRPPTALASRDSTTTATVHPPLQAAESTHASAERQPVPTSRPTSSADAPAGTPSGAVILHDRRLAQRVAFATRARLQWEGHDVACATEDISMRGARLRFPHDMPPTPPPAMGTIAQVTLALDGHLTLLKARVGWQRPDPAGPVLGVQFLGIQRHQEQLLQPIVLEGTPV